MNIKSVKIIERVFLGLIIISIGLFFYHRNVTYIRPYTYDIDGKLSEIKSSRKSIKIRLEDSETDFYIQGFYLTAIKERKHFLENARNGAYVSMRVINDGNVNQKSQDVATIKINNVEYSDFESLKRAYKIDQIVGRKISFIIIPIGIIAIILGIFGRYPSFFKRIKEVQENNKELQQYDKTKILYYNIRIANSRIILYIEDALDLSFEFDLEKQVFKFYYLKIIPVNLKFGDLKYFGFSFDNSYFNIMMQLNNNEILNICSLAKKNYIDIFEDQSLYMEECKDLVVFFNKVISHPNKQHS